MSEFSNRHIIPTYDGKIIDLAAIKGTIDALNDILALIGNPGTDGQVIGSDDGVPAWISAGGDDSRFHTIDLTGIAFDCAPEDTDTVANTTVFPALKAALEAGKALILKGFNNRDNTYPTGMINAMDIVDYSALQQNPYVMIELAPSNVGGSGSYFTFTITPSAITLAFSDYM